MEEVDRLCDRNVIVDHGKVVASDTRDGLLKLFGAEKPKRFEIEGAVDDETLAWLAAHVPAGPFSRRGRAPALILPSPPGHTDPSGRRQREPDLRHRDHQHRTGAGRSRDGREAAAQVREGGAHRQRQGSAAGVIHTDFEHGFIRAEVIAYVDFIVCKGEHAAKDAGKMRLEGKEYVVKDGDVMHFRFNV